MELISIKVMAVLSLITFFLSTNSYCFELIAHKGVHHEIDYTRKQIINPTNPCPSHDMLWSNHSYIENTIPSIREAFRLGADRVEIDLWNSFDNEVVLYHDESLLCRAGVDSKIYELSLSQLKKIDLSAKYSFYGRSDNPMAGKGKGKITTLEEVLNTFPNKGFLLNPKTSNPLFLKKLIKILRTYESEKKIDLKQFSFWGPEGAWKALSTNFPHIQSRFSDGIVAIQCGPSYREIAWSGIFPKICTGLNIVLSAKEMKNWNTWGGPLGLIQAFHAAGQKVYLLNVDNQDELRRFRSLGVDGVITSRMDRIYDP